MDNLSDGTSFLLILRSHRQNKVSAGKHESSEGANFFLESHAISSLISYQKRESSFYLLPSTFYLQPSTFYILPSTVRPPAQSNRLIAGAVVARSHERNQNEQLLLQPLLCYDNSQLVCENKVTLFWRKNYNITVQLHITRVEETRRREVANIVIVVVVARATNINDQHPIYPPTPI